MIEIYVNIYVEQFCVRVAKRYFGLVVVVVLSTVVGPPFFPGKGMPRGALCWEIPGEHVSWIFKIFECWCPRISRGRSGAEL